MPGPKTNEREGTRAVLRNEGVSAYKVRQVLDLIRGQEVGRARDTLALCERDAALLVGKLLGSAIANAENNDGLDPEELFVSACYADEGPTAKRWRPRARGRATRIRKRSCHITVIVSRLPEERLNRLRARQAAEAGNRRARRVAGGRQGRRTRRDEQRPGTAPAPEAAATTAATPAPEPVEEAPATGISTEETAATETVTEATAADGTGAEATAGAAGDDSDSGAGATAAPDEEKEG
ncbi:MAG: 50S ribosomal protein L22 [Actinomycetota bacterium]